MMLLAFPSRHLGQERGKQSGLLTKAMPANGLIFGNCTFLGAKKGLTMVKIGLRNKYILKIWLKVDLTGILAPPTLSAPFG